MRVRAGSGSYPVVVEAGLLERLDSLLRGHVDAHRLAVVSDDTVARIHGAAVADRLGAAEGRARLFAFPAGEASKTRRTWSELTDRILAWGMGRDGAVVAVGGGVTGDLAGFVAATYMRGVPVVQVPTSLVAMVDSAVGGKTGLDTPAGKNLVGAFHPPALVAVDPEATATLPRAQRAQGLVEAVKHGAILDRDYLDRLESDLERLLEGDPEATGRAVRRSVEIKARVVEEDERESGLRQVLNFGHTAGHALEAAAGYRIPHGSAVAAGMVLEARIGERLGVTEEGTAALLARIVEDLGLPLEPRAGVSPERILERVARDKKGRGGRPRWVLLEAPGRLARGEGWSREVPDEVVAEVLETWWREEPSERE